LSFAFAVLEVNPDDYMIQPTEAGWVKHRVGSWIELEQADSESLNIAPGR
jgi:hypothetical protein